MSDPSWYTLDHKAWLAAYERRRRRRDRQAFAIMALMSLALLVAVYLVMLGVIR